MSYTTALTVNQLTIKIYNSRLEMGVQAAADVAPVLRSLLAQRDSINMIFAAAPSQNEFLDSLCRQPGIDWSKVNAFHMDEYIGLTVDAPQRFGQFLKERVFDRLPFKQVFYINGNVTDAAAECERYSDLLKQYPVDVVCMGIGENGHIAFNDPHVADFNDAALVKTVQLAAASRYQQVHDGCFKKVEQVPVSAITLTIPALMKASIICCVVPGSHKADAVFHTLNSAVNEENPATVLRTHANATLYLDKDSAVRAQKTKETN